MPLLCSIAAIVLSALAIAGQTKAAQPVKDIYMLQINLTEATSTFSSLTSGSVNLESYGIGEIYSFGMWGYCKGDSQDGKYNVTYCSKPKSMYVFDPVSLFEDELNVSVTLPDKVKDYITVSKVVSKLIFITGLIGACSAVLTGVFTIVSFKSHMVSCIAMLFGIISFVALALCAAASTAMFSIFEKYFNDEASTYGITASLGDKHFYAFIWAATAAALIACILNFFAICCGSTRSRGGEPKMGYHERGYSSDYKHGSDSD